ncbi:hypothetical protein [Halohasta litorea]|uniref:Uncharacterized protein n=2 Tax=Haloferacaceae TaxID=1644056 RepID=A0ABD6DDM7_9EURY|nr:hypothetical protein [Halohasta litorea]
MCNNAQAQRKPPMSQTGLSREEFVAIGETVGEQVDTDIGGDSQVKYQMEPYYADTTGEITLCFKAQDEPVIIVESIPARGSERGITLTAPASEWTVANDVDDHNIITTLSIAQEVGHTAELYFRGPPAKLTPEGIVTDGPVEYPPLFNE